MSVKKNSAAKADAGKSAIQAPPSTAAASNTPTASAEAKADASETQLASAAEAGELVGDGQGDALPEFDAEQEREAEAIAFDNDVVRAPDQVSPGAEEVTPGEIEVLSERKYDDGRHVRVLSDGVRTWKEGAE